MDNLDEQYKYFMAALKHEADSGSQTSIAVELKVSLSYINQIINNKKKAGHKTQVKIANACGYKIEDFLAFGMSIINGTTVSARPEDNEDMIEKINLYKQLVETKDQLIKEKDQRIAELERQLAEKQRMSEKELPTGTL